MLDLFDPDTLMTLGMAGASWGYWRRNEVRDPDPVVDEDPWEPPSLPWLQQVWRDFVEPVAGLAPGARLVDIEHLGGDNWSATIIPAPGGRQTPKSLQALAPNICQAYVLPPGSVDITPVAARARLTVMRESKIYDPVVWTGPTVDVTTGLASPGRYVDGKQSTLRFFTPGSGAKHWLVYGATGAGKTHFLNWSLMESTRARFVDADGVERGLFSTYLGDGKGGQSIPDWIDSPAIAWAATTHREILRMCRAAKRELQWRTTYLARLRWVDDKGRERRGLRDFDPVAARLPYLQVVIDELPLAVKTHPEIVGLLLDLARGGRSAGVRVVVGAQSISAMELGGMSDLRGMITGNGNVIAFRTNDPNQKRMGLAGEDAGGINPAELPNVIPGTTVEVQGMSLLGGPDKRAGTLHRTCALPDVYDWASTAPPVELHPGSVRAGGYDLAVWRWRLDGRIRDDVDPPVAGPERPPADEGDLWPYLVVPDFLRAPVVSGDGRAAAAVGEQPGPAPVEAGATSKEQRLRVLLEAIGSGPTRRKDIIERCKHLGVSLRTQTNDLAELAQAGRIHQVPGAAPGTWACGPGRDAAVA